jgi:hypothetical protein
LPRKRKQDIKVNNTDSLEGLMQEIYNDGCLQINEAQNAINELSTGTTPQDIDDHTKVAKEKAGLLKVKEAGIRIKLEVAKLQSDILKNKGDAESAISERSQGSASLNDFKSIREMIKKDKLDILNNENQNEID